MMLSTCRKCGNPTASESSDPVYCASCHEAALSRLDQEVRRVPNPRTAGGHRRDAFISPLRPGRTSRREGSLVVREVRRALRMVTVMVAFTVIVCAAITLLAQFGLLDDPKTDYHPMGVAQ